MTDMSASKAAAAARPMILQALRRRPHDDARDRSHRPGPGRPHPPQGNRGRANTKSGPGNGDTATGAVMPATAQVPVVKQLAAAAD
jgi:hypothetical protein